MHIGFLNGILFYFSICNNALCKAVFMQLISKQSCLNFEFNFIPFRYEKNT